MIRKTRFDQVYRTRARSDKIPVPTALGTANMLSAREMLRPEPNVRAS